MVGEDVYGQIFEAWHFFERPFLWASPFLNSQFFAALATIFGASFGAFWAAKAAYSISRDNELREQSLNEIRSVNTAIAFVRNILHVLVIFKIEGIKPLKEDYDHEKIRVLETLRKSRLDNNIQEEDISFTAIFCIFDLSPVPIEEVQKTVFHKLSLDGHSIGLVIRLGQFLHSLYMCIEKRNQLIGKYKELTDQNQLRSLYFGIPNSQGVDIGEYPSYLEGIFEGTNCSIKCAEWLGENLMAHGKDLAQTFEKKFGAGTPPIDKMVFDNFKKNGIIPTDEKYKDLLDFF